MRESPSAAPDERTEEAFYTSYGWCLNPFLSVRELFQRLREDLNRVAALDWQREECRINVYLFSCAIACTVDDYLARPARNPTPYLKGVPGAIVPLLERATEHAHSLWARFVDRRVIRWRDRWQRWVNVACEILATHADPGDAKRAELRHAVELFERAKLPERLLRRRMAVPAAFRNQDLTHHDVRALACRCAATGSDPDAPVAVMGLRTAGAYLAPLLATHLTLLGHRAVAWIAIRPGHALPRCERQRLRELLGLAGRVLVVDEFPRTGRTFRLALRLLTRDFAVNAERITVVAPLHPSQPEWSLVQPPEAAPPVKQATLEPSELFKARWLLSDATAAPLLREYYSRGGWEDVRLEVCPEADAVDAELQRQPEKGRERHARLKRVFRVRLEQSRAAPIVRYVAAKSVGWGWLSYHAYLAGSGLAGLVPRVLGLRHGLLWTEWAGPIPSRDEPGIGGPAAATLQGIDPGAVGTYVARRAARLRLAEDPFAGNTAPDLNGWAVLTQILRRVYGVRLGRLKSPVLRRALGRYVSPVPALVDGRMHRHEWIITDGAILKTDFEQHNFGSGELNIVDPAYDLAAAAFELRLSEEAEAALLSAYAEGSGDRTVGARLLLYKLLYGVVTMREAASQRPVDARQNDRYQAARRFLVHEMHRHCATRILEAPGAAWSRTLFSLDLDGVFDCDVLGFPHTSASGLTALALLQGHRYSVIPCTARSIADVRSFCRTYGLPGGLAEDGSVFYDAVEDREWSLLDEVAAAQLARCRAVIRQLPEVFTDPAYKYAIRAYRYQGHETVAPDRRDLGALLARDGLDRLTFRMTLGDALIAPRAVSKGRALLAAKRRLEGGVESVAAIGDSERDVSMLEVADFAYAPANCSNGIRELARQGRCRIMALPRQRGLLAAVRDLLRRSAAGDDALRLPTRVCLEPHDHPVVGVLRAADRTPLRALLAACDWRSL